MRRHCPRCLRGHAAATKERWVPPIQKLSPTPRPRANRSQKARLAQPGQLLHARLEHCAKQIASATAFVNRESAETISSGPALASVAQRATAPAPVGHAWLNAAFCLTNPLQPTAIRLANPSFSRFVSMGPGRNRHLGRETDMDTAWGRKGINEVPHLQFVCRA